MRFSFFFLLLFVVPLFTQAQVRCLNADKNFGEINRDSDRVVDLQFVNEGSEKAFLLRYRFPREFSILPAAREVAPKDTLVIRYQFNPIKKGRQNFDVPIYFSTQQDPIEISVKADVDFIDPYTNPQCPSFDEMAMANADRFGAKFEVLDSQTGSPIPKAQIRIIDRGEVAAQLKTDRKGKSEATVPISYYYMLAEASGYSYADSASYINRRNNFFRFYLDPIEDTALSYSLSRELGTRRSVRLRSGTSLEEGNENVSEENSAQETEQPLEDESAAPEEEPDIVIVIGEEQEEEKPIETTKEPRDEPTVALEDEGEFAASAFKPNNIVLLVDVSSSMGGKGKMQLLQASMIELLELLRPIDQVTIITYATRVNVVLPTTSAANKEEIKAIIKDLEARGKTAGAQGVKKAFKTAQIGRIEGGNNQVIIASDGAFKMEDKPVIEKTVRKYQRKTIDLSVIGIKGTKAAKEQLGKLAEVGNGAYMEVDSYDEATQALVEEIKSKSRIKR